MGVVREDFAGWLETLLKFERDMYSDIIVARSLTGNLPSPQI